MSSLFEMIQEAKAAIEKRSAIVPEVGVILGTGLGRLAEAIDTDAAIP